MLTTFFELQDLLNILNGTDDGKLVLSMWRMNKETFQDDHHRGLLAGCVISEEIKDDLNKTYDLLY